MLSMRLQKKKVMMFMVACYNFDSYWLLKGSLSTKIGKFVSAQLNS